MYQVLTLELLYETETIKSSGDIKSDFSIWYRNLHSPFSLATARILNAVLIPPPACPSGASNLHNLLVSLLLLVGWITDFVASQPVWSSQFTHCLTFIFLLLSSSNPFYIFLITLYVRNYAKWFSTRVDLAVSGDIFDCLQGGWVGRDQGCCYISCNAGQLPNKNELFGSKCQ